MYLVKPKQATVSKGKGAIVQVDGPRQKEVVGGLETIVVLQSEGLSGRLRSISIKLKAFCDQ